MTRFAYEYAERTLDSFAGTVGSKQFCRSYAKFKFVLGVFAYCDFSYPKKPTLQEMAWAWEDAQIAFKGHGEPILHGCILQMWSTLPASRKEEFLEAVETALRLADENTSLSVQRRYLKEWRDKPVRDPDLGYNLMTILPVSGPTLREWSAEEGFDPLEHEAYLLSVEAEERREEGYYTTHTTGANKRRLRVYEGGLIGEVR